jgi:trehalose 6-phosphate synthase/phosphatase
MQERLRRYNINRWAKDFIHKLQKAKADLESYSVKRIVPEIRNKMVKDFKAAQRRILFIDYDGTLVGFRKTPSEAAPDKTVYNLLDKLAGLDNTEVVLISGRDKKTFNKWFGKSNYALIAEHGVWIKNRTEDWQFIEPMHNEWKENIRPIIEFYVDRTPGSLLEEKDYSLVWHYRRTDPELSTTRANELKDELTSLIANHNLEIMEGNKVIEIKNAGINKGRAALYKLHNTQYDYVVAIGDDWTDEYMFEELSSLAVTIKVGRNHTVAKYSVDSYVQVRELLSEFGS